MQAELTITGRVGSLAVTGKAVRSEEGLIGQEVPLPAGKPGTLSTRTDDTTGIATLASGHGITVSDLVDVYWSGGVRYGCTVTAQDATTVTLGSDAQTGGDVLPVESTVLVVTPRVEFAVGFDGDELKLLAAGCDQRANIDFHTSGDVSIAAFELPQNEAWAWVSAQAVANPLAGSVVAKVQASNGSGTAAATVTIVGIYNSLA